MLPRTRQAPHATDSGMKNAKRTASVLIAFAVTGLLTIGSASASAVPEDPEPDASASGIPDTTDPGTSSDYNYPDYPEGEEAGEIYMESADKGYIFFDDYDGDKDRDDFYLYDFPSDARYVGLAVKNNGQTYKTWSHNETTKLNVGNIDKGTTVNIRACVFTENVKVGCMDGEYTE